MNHAIAKVCAAINADDAGVHLDADEMREVIAALDERERAIGHERTRADAAEADRDALRAECERLRAENTDLATVAYRAASLAVERNRWRARAEMVGARVNDAERITAEAMRQGLAACRDLRGRLRGEGLRLARAVAVVTAVRHEHATRAAWLATLPACASAPAAVLAAEAATRAALDGVPVAAAEWAPWPAHEGWWWMHRAGWSEPRLARADDELDVHELSDRIWYFRADADMYRTECRYELRFLGAGITTPRLP